MQGDSSVGPGLYSRARDPYPAAIARPSQARALSKIVTFSFGPKNRIPETDTTDSTPFTPGAALVKSATEVRDPHATVEEAPWVSPTKEDLSHALKTYRSDLEFGKGVSLGLRTCLCSKIEKRCH